jgi:DNA repair exonuclease SbcCD ATPase subunit
MITPRLIAIELEAFRGFTRPQRLSLDAKAILIRGDNGAGKTSLIDAFLWLFCGRLQYLEDRVRDRKLRQDEDVVRSRFTDAAARVTLEVTANGTLYRFTREGSQKDHHLEAFLDGRPVAAPELLMGQVFGHASINDLQASLLAWGVLRQDAVRATLDTAGGALHERLARIVGLEQVSGFAEATKQTARSLQNERTASKKALESLQRTSAEAADRYRMMRRDLTGRPSGDEQLKIVRQAASALPAGFELALPDLVESSTVEGLGRALTPAIEALAALRSARSARMEAAASPIGDITSIEQAVIQAQTRLSEASRSGPTAVRLAEAALEALSGDACPVCDQRVDSDDLAAHLRATIAQSQQLFSAAQDASDALSRESARLSAARSHQQTLAELDERITAAERRASDELAQLGFAKPPTLPTNPADLEVAAQALDRVRSELRALWRLANVSDEATLSRIAAEASALEEEVATVGDNHKKLSARYERAKALERGAHVAAEEIVAKALTRLEPSFAEVFERLNPSSAFSELRARQDIFRNVNQVVPVVRDAVRAIDANPLLVFSEGQLNVVALSYFLGMALNAREAMLPFLILDDPLQALDTIAVLGFGDLCRRIRDDRQLIITTHDRRFADILGRKLAPRNDDQDTIIHDFEGWTREGPSIKTIEAPRAEILPLKRLRAI